MSLFMICRNCKSKHPFFNHVLLVTFERSVPWDLIAVNVMHQGEKVIRIMYKCWCGCRFGVSEVAD